MCNFVFENRGKTIKHKCALLKQINELGDNIKFDHGYTASSPPIVNVSIHVYLDTFNLIR